MPTFFGGKTKEEKRVEGKATIEAENILREQIRVQQVREEQLLHQEKVLSFIADGGFKGDLEKRQKSFSSQFNNFLEANNELSDDERTQFLARGKQAVSGALVNDAIAKQGMTFEYRELEKLGLSRVSTAEEAKKEVQSVQRELEVVRNKLREMHGNLEKVHHNREMHFKPAMR